MHRRPDGTLIVSATDLVAFLECGHLTQLDRAAAADLIPKPDRKDDPAVELLRRRGGEHEQRYLDQLRDEGLTITSLDVPEGEWTAYETRAAQTIEAMERGDDVIFQATVFDGRWVGHPDFLLRVAGASRFGDYHYEVADTKLARSAKASALIQICSYVDQIERIQGVRPNKVYVVTGGAKIETHPFRTAEMMSYYRHAKQRFDDALDEARVGPRTWPIPRAESYPDPVEHCAVCRWYPYNCRVQWLKDDALPLVAGIGREQRKVLTAHDVNTMRGLSELTQPLNLDLKRGQNDSMWRMREQARLQVESAAAHRVLYEFLDPETDTNNELVPNRGLAALPPPSDNDLFFDIEGDPFAFWEGLEYLFGIWDGAVYRALWAMDRDQEKQQFQAVMDLFFDHWKQHPDMHIYHYGVYEPSRLKNLAGRHATRQDELDALLTAGVFVDLYRVVRQGIRVGAERYSIKNLEPLYGFTRVIELRDANSSIVEFELYLETGGTNDALKESIAGYNKDDCVSTEKLRDWLEGRREEAAEKFGVELPRPRKEAEKPPETPSKWEARLTAVTESLTAGLPTDPAEVAEDPNAEATWLLVNLLDWHRREDKASWWRFFELMTLSDDELFEELEPIGRLHYEGVVDVTKSGKNVHRYSFPAQEHKVGNRSDLYDPRLPPFGEGELGKGVIDKDALSLDITRPAEWTGPHPTSVVPHDRIPNEGLQDGLARFGEWVSEHGMGSNGDAAYQAMRDLLLRNGPRVEGRTDPNEPLKQAGEPGGDAAKRLAPALSGTTLAIQGPPGSGKTYSGARMILKLIREPGRNRRVGITGSSHKVITNLLEEVWKTAATDGYSFEALQRIDATDTEAPPWSTAKDNGKFDKLLASEDHDFRVLAGTVWLWARDEMAGSVDTLFVDEAGQISLASVVAAGGAARNIVLLGDPQQLDQVLQGSHPPGAEQPALGHFLGKSDVVPPNKGVFLEKTWRMHPDITAYTSELFYEGELKSVDGLEQQRVLGDGDWSGSGLRWVEVQHDGNTNASREEAEKVVEIVRSLLGQDWINQYGERRAIAPYDIRVVSPYNAHRLLIEELLASAGIYGVPVGTVDKFQGQEAAVSIYTMATSRPEDAPRGMSFLFSLNRLNVATSRARALAIVVASPRLLSAVPATPDQLRMANGLCAFEEFGRPAAALAPAPTEPPTSETTPSDGKPVQLVMQLD
jgi:predicted RecB family nuclease